MERKEAVRAEGGAYEQHQRVAQHLSRGGGKTCKGRAKNNTPGYMVSSSTYSSSTMNLRREPRRWGGASGHYCCAVGMQLFPPTRTAAVMCWVTSRVPLFAKSASCFHVHRMVPGNTRHKTQHPPAWIYFPADSIDSKGANRLEQMICMICSHYDLAHAAERGTYILHMVCSRPSTFFVGSICMTSHNCMREEPDHLSIDRDLSDLWQTLTRLYRPVLG